MPDPSERAALAGDVLRDRFAQARLPREFARLYSQHVRLRTRQPSLETFSEEEAGARLSDAVRLVDASFLAKERGEDGWRAGLRRSAELLEWLAHPEMNEVGLPLSLLGAACYHLAGYPARASSLAAPSTTELDAPLLRMLLRSDYEGLLTEAPSLALDLRRQRVDEDAAQSDANVTAAALRDAIVAEIAGALGVLAAEMRWGQERRASNALEKLRLAAPAAITVADPYEWLLLKLTAEAASAAMATALRVPIRAISADLGEEARDVFERYVRVAYQSRQSLVWPSQARGLARLAEGQSFALCTPTGSGKTRVAEVALLDALYRVAPSDSDAGPLCLYIVPTRSLAAEVESRLSRVLRRASGARALTVTGLYGGNDWGPNDDWLLRDDPTVLICTQEKCEAIVRFFGEAVLPRLRVVIIDEAHEVQHVGSEEQLERLESRALRLEALVARLRSSLPDARFIAMSAVAHELEAPLARWISNDRESTPVSSDYRSTRQLVGRLICRRDGSTRIDYDVLDAELIRTRDIGEDAPYVPRPFPSMPTAEAFTGPKKGMAPFALWAAIQLAAGDGDSGHQSVLISVAEGIGNFVGWCTTLLEETWSDEILPVFFTPPTEESDDYLAWMQALTVTEDLFGTDSREFRLLELGVVVHHGRMPGRLPRLLVELVERRVVRVVIATSTLTQGVNLPFETILIPGLSRREGPLGSQEFANLLGRAGRPGVGTEGQALVLMLDGLAGWQRDRARREYFDTLRAWVGGREDLTTSSGPIGDLIDLIWSRWGGDDVDEFENWLESTAVAPDESDGDGGLVGPIDALDALVLACLQEAGETDATEETLARVWSQSFSRYASAEEERQRRAFIARGPAVAERFSDAEERRRVYRTSLRPREAADLFVLAPELMAHLRTGGDYWRWEASDRYEYVEHAVELVGQVERFRVKERVGSSSAGWKDALRWWLDPSSAERRPTISQVGVWHDFISTQFAYQFSWGLAAVILGSTATEPAIQDEVTEDVPAAAMWTKDLVLWGTLNPVAAHVLSINLAQARPQAEALGDAYFRELDPDDSRDPLDSQRIQEWTELLVVDAPSPGQGAQALFRVELQEEVPPDLPRWPVVPLAAGEQLLWCDVAGFHLASSSRPDDWDASAISQLDYVLEASDGVVRARPYM